MLVQLRYLAFGCLVLMVAGILVIHSYFNQSKRKSALEAAQNQAVSILQGYNAMVWAYHGVDISTKLNKSPNIKAFSELTQYYFSSQPLVSVGIYSAEDHLPFYVPPDKQTLSRNGATLTIPPLAVRGFAPSTQMMEDVTYSVTNSRNELLSRSGLSVLQVVMPLMIPGDTVKSRAYVVAYLDITAPMGQLSHDLYIFIGSLVGIFILLIGLLLFISSRAEHIISKQHELNLELTAAAAQAEAQSRDKSQFLASVSHELRTPLNAIIGFSDIIRNEAKQHLQKIYQDYLDDIHASGKHLLSLINDILDYSKAEAGKLQIEWAETDVTKVIRNSLRMVLPRAEAAQVTMIEDVPTQHLVIVTDAKKLKQVLLNLLSNAVKFTQAGGEVKCHAWMDIASGDLNIQVKDTGIGIAPKDISRVMSPFGQVDSALSRKYEGTGLGLPLSKKFIESMGGSFTIESQLKVGTRVTITLPKAPPGWAAGSFAKPRENSEKPDVVRA